MKNELKKTYKKQIKTTMKNLITIIALTVASVTVAQEDYSSYTSSYTNKSYPLSVSYSSPEKYTLYIDALSLDETHKTGGITLNQNQHESFIASLKEAEQKYSEWVTTAKSNAVTELDKNMTIKAKSGAYFLYGSKWNFQFTVNLTFNFKVIDDPSGVEYVLIFRTGRLQSSSNQYMKVDGFVLVFTSQEEISEFMETISTQGVTSFINAPKQTELFKD